MKILIVNDDSIHAPGIHMLARAAAQMGDVYVVAPEDQCSAMAQKLTIRENLVVRAYENFPAPVKGAWSVSGTPVDCVKVALLYILEEQPDLVLSGVNNGYNLGFDTAYSGTMGAALEAARKGIDAIALSTSHKNDLEKVAPHVLPTIEKLLEKPLVPGELWNVNFPNVNERQPKGILWDRPMARISMFTEKYSPVARPDGSVELLNEGFVTKDDFIAPGTDAEAVRSGWISVSKFSAF